MKKFFLVPIYLWATVSFAQTTLKTLYCNELQNVALILPNEIQQAVTGSENFVFSYNKNSLDSLGLLQGRRGPDSNLIIRTMDGNLYSYLLKYKDTLQQFTYFIAQGERVNPLPRVTSVSKKLKEKPNSIIKDSIAKTIYFKKLSTYYLKKTSNQRVDIEKKNKLQLEVKSIDYYKEEVYVVYVIRNRSGIDFEINSLELFKVQGKRSRRSSYQKWGISPIYKYDFPTIVLDSKDENFLIVYPKFTLGDNEKLEIVLTEKRGSRYLKLSVYF